MDKLLDNPSALIALLCIVGFVIGINAALFSALTQGKINQRQASKWIRAFSGGAQARQRQNDQLAELHQRVQQIQTPLPDEEK